MSLGFHMARKRAAENERRVIKNDTPPTLNSAESTETKKDNSKRGGRKSSNLNSAESTETQKDNSRRNRRKSSKNEEEHTNDSTGSSQNPPEDNG